MVIRPVEKKDLPAVLTIYNEGIEDRIATLETKVKDASFIDSWFDERTDVYAAFVACDGDEILGWVALNPYSPRDSYSGVSELSVYITRTHRGQGIGKQLLRVIEEHAVSRKLHKIILFTFPFNKLGQRLYVRAGYRIVGTFKEQGRLNGYYVDVMAMEKILPNGEV
ncbi:arsinothricin resistance N-acetyltransferase ArsN1 family A [Exiguobacterium flavidum]|uniref:arsinothricin resistance N-acetyltransferase ArsN1 family A n=1 Tax=Exiguobacterium flavidum TaxID=2184695 RepID=UPI000DF74937|nr:arsinothricin resistance N-acetyltransferase ArsN1 family A [Exiguobacterium flavidum]